MTGREYIHVGHLLSFTAVFALPPHLSRYAEEGREALLQRIFTAPLKYPPGTHYSYNDAPYLLLGMVAERILGRPLDDTADSMFYHPLGMRATTFHPATLATMQIAPTEINQRGEVAGTVHDEKAWALYKEGQIPGSAGIFSTAGDLLRFCRMLLNEGTLNDRRYFKPSAIALMQTEVAGKEGYSFSYGWMIQASFMGSRLSPGAFGKDGFTGTALLVDITKQRCLVVLTNRTYPKRPDTPVAMHEVRRDIANLLFG
jgi:CubicO group peptidase (beta-lactamase class C family)